MEGKKEMASWSVLGAVDGLLLRGCVVASEANTSAQEKGVEYLTRFVHTLPLADTLGYAKGRVTSQSGCVNPLR